MDDEEEELFGEWFLKVMEHAYPNPGRTGCPDPQVLRDIVFRKGTDVETVRKVVSHMLKCSECCQDARACLKERRRTTGK